MPSLFQYQVVLLRMTNTVPSKKQKKQGTCNLMCQPYGGEGEAGEKGEARSRNERKGRIGRQQGTNVIRCRSMRLTFFMLYAKG